MFVQKKIITHVLPFLLLFILSGCALQLPPGGGEIDKIPPEIVYCYPLDGTMNYDKDYIEFEFSEYVDKRKFKDALFISPAIEGELELSWTNTGVTVTFPEKLKANKTYTVTIGTDVTDLHNNNRMADSYTLKFSTGNKIDNGVISGYVFDPKPSGIMVYVYDRDSAMKGPDIVKPDYITQAGEDGAFKFSGIGNGTFRLFAMRDGFKDFLFQPDQDEIGFTYKDVVLSEKDSLTADLSFQMQKIDTVFPRILTAVMTDEKHILLNFSEDLNFKTFNLTNFIIADTVSHTVQSPAGMFKGRTKEKEFVLALTDTLYNSQSSQIIISGFKDLFGNTTLSDTVSLVSTDKPDTNRPAMLQAVPQRNASDVNFQKMLCTFQFDDMVSGNDSCFILRDTSKRTVKTELIKNDDASWSLRPMERLKPFTDYETIVFGVKLKDPAGNFTDTVIINRFKTMNDIDFTGVYGKVISWDSTKTAVLRFVNIADTSIQYQTVLPVTGIFGIGNMIPGKYEKVFFYDENKNFNWDKGTLTPFSFAERGMRIKEPLALAARWSVTDYTIDLSVPPVKPKEKSIPE